MFHMPCNMSAATFPFNMVCQQDTLVLDYFLYFINVQLYMLFPISARKTREASYFFAKARRWPRFNTEMIPELILTDRNQLRNPLTALSKSHIKEIILFCDHRDLADIMNEVTT